MELNKDVLAAHEIESRESAVDYLAAKAGLYTDLEFMGWQPDFQAAAWQLELCADVLRLADHYWPKKETEGDGIKRKHDGGSEGI